MRVDSKSVHGVAQTAGGQTGRSKAGIGNDDEGRHGRPGACVKKCSVSALNITSCKEMGLSWRKERLHSWAGNRHWEITKRDKWRLKNLVAILLYFSSHVTDSFAFLTLGRYHVPFSLFYPPFLTHLDDLTWKILAVGILLFGLTQRHALKGQPPAHVLLVTVQNKIKMCSLA